MKTITQFLNEAFSSAIIANLHKNNPDTMNQFFRSLAKFRYSAQGLKDEFITVMSVADSLKKNKSDKILKIWMKGPKIAFFSVANTVIDVNFNWNTKSSRGKRDNNAIIGDKDLIASIMSGAKWDSIGLTDVYAIAISSFKALGEKKQPTEVPTKNDTIEKTLTNDNESISYKPKNKKELEKIIDSLIETNAVNKNGVLTVDLNCIDVSGINDMSKLFYLSTYNFDVSKWNVSKVKNMSGMFHGCKNFNSDVSKWNVSNVTDMSHMFHGCENFNSDLSKWNVSNLQNAESMFEYCEIFNSNLSNWNVSNLRNPKSMFYGCSRFNGDLGNWNIKNFANVINMFSFCKSFEGKNLHKWDLQNIDELGGFCSHCDSLKEDFSKTNLYNIDWVNIRIYGLPFDKDYPIEKIPIPLRSKYMPKKSNIAVETETFTPYNKEELQKYIKMLTFRYPDADIIDLNHIDVSGISDFSNLFQGLRFRFDLSKWDVSRARNMSGMFKGASIKCDISKWNVSNCENFSYMFQDCVFFNCDLSKWDVSRALLMDYMFTKCLKFNSDLSKWNVSKVNGMQYMFYGCSEFNSDLSKWDVSNVRDMTGMFLFAKNFNSDLSKWKPTKLKKADSAFEYSKVNPKNIIGWPIDITKMFDKSQLKEIL